MILLLFFLLVSPAFAFETWSGKVVGVIDGDTMDVLHDGQAERIRLNGIDCPEKSQPFGKKAKEISSELVFGKEITVRSYKRDRHGRTVADVLINDTSLSYELVKLGLAWWYQKYSKDQELETLEAEARLAKRGLWADPNPIPPWDFRHPQHQEALMLSPGGNLFLSSTQDADSAPIIANKQTHIYHRPDCPSYTGTAPKNRRIFTSPAEAEAAGYRVAKTCP